MTKIKKTKLKAKKTALPQRVEEAIVCISSSFNNIILSLTDLKGNVLGWASAGSLDFKGTKKSTPYAAASVAQTIIEKAKKLGVVKLYLRAKGAGPGRDSALRAFSSSDFDVETIVDVTPMPHGGVRPKKPRKV